MYHVAYQALHWLDPSGDWQEIYLELKDADNQGPGKESDKEGTGDGTYFCSWIWLLNPQVHDTTDSEAGEEGASKEDINKVLHVKWTTSFMRLERWAEEVELLQEEMQRVVVFLEWKSQDWLARVEVYGGNSTPDIQLGLNTYTKKQAAIYHDLAILFMKLWHPMLMSYDLQHSWVTEYMTKHGVSLINTNISASQAWGIFKHRLSKNSHSVASVTAAEPSNLAAMKATINNGLLREANYNKDNDLEDTDDNSSLGDTDSAFEDDSDDDLDL